MKIQEHTDLEVYKKAFDAAMLIFHVSKEFPKEETYSLDSAIVALGLREFGRSMAQTPV